LVSSFLGDRLRQQICKACGYKVNLMADVKPLEFCPICDSPNLEIKE